MRKAILSVAFAALWMITTAATTEPVDRESVGVTGTEVVGVGNSVKVSFSLHIGDRVIRNGQSLVITPVLRGAGEETALTPVIVRANAGLAKQETEAMRAAGIGNWSGRATPYYTTGGKTVEYAVSIARQEWMRECELVLEGINVGKRDATEVAMGTVADNLLSGVVAAVAPTFTEPVAQTVASNFAEPTPATPTAQLPKEPTPVAPVAQLPAVPAEAYRQPQAFANPPLPEEQPQVAYDRGLVVQKPFGAHDAVHDYSPREGYYSDTPVPTPAQGTVGDELAAKFTFVEPVANFNRAKQATADDRLFDYNMPLILGSASAPANNETDKFIEMTREGAVYVRFNPGSHSVARATGDNNRMLVNLISSILALESSPDARIAQVVIAGFSSPEGTFEENEKMAMERASVIRDFLIANSNITPDLISVYNGSVDWATLRALIADSNMPEKYELLDIIDNTPAWDASRSRGRIGKLRALNGGEQYRYMREHFFPQLRQTGAYVKVYYENVR